MFKQIQSLLSNSLRTNKVTSYYLSRNYYSKHEYYKEKNAIKTIAQLYAFINNKYQHYTLLKTQKKIAPFKLKTGSGAREATKLFGKPAFIFNNTEHIHGHIIYFYKRKVNKFKFLIQIHFINQSMFFTRNEVYASNSLNDEEKFNIIKLLIAKYCNLEQITDNNLHIKITDKENSSMYTSNDLNFSVNYINKDHYFVESVHNMYLKSIKKAQSKQRLLEKKLMHHI